MVMGIDSRSKGCILDGHFFTYYCCYDCNVCLKRPKINEKEAGVGPFFLKNRKKIQIIAKSPLLCHEFLCSKDPK